MDKVDRKVTRATERARALEEELERRDKDQDRVLRALSDAVEATGKPRKRRGRFIVLLGIAGVAYLFGAKAGRERYDQIMEKVKRAMDRGADKIESIEPGAEPAM